MVGPVGDPAVWLFEVLGQKGDRSPELAVQGLMTSPVFTALGEQLRECFPGLKEGGWSRTAGDGLPRDDPGLAESMRQLVRCRVRVLFKTEGAG